jgi:hypothetical protein
MFSVPINMYERLLADHFPPLKDESREDWLHRIADHRVAARVHTREVGKLARSADAVPAKQRDDT